MKTLHERVKKIECLFVYAIQIMRETEESKIMNISQSASPRLLSFCKGMPRTEVRGLCIMSALRADMLESKI